MSHPILDLALLSSCCWFRLRGRLPVACPCWPREPSFPSSSGPPPAPLSTVQSGSLSAFLSTFLTGATHRAGPALPPKEGRQRCDGVTHSLVPCATVLGTTSFTTGVSLGLPGLHRSVLVDVGSTVLGTERALNEQLLPVSAVSAGARRRGEAPGAGMAAPPCGPCSVTLGQRRHLSRPRAFPAFPRRRHYYDTRQNGVPAPSALLFLQLWGG